MDTNAALQYSSHNDTTPIWTANIAPIENEYYKVGVQCKRCSLQIAYLKERAESAYWQSMHKRATEREQKLKVEIEELTAKLRLRERQLFAAKTEKNTNSNHIGLSKSDDNKRKRGQQTGKPGHGRRIHRDIPVLEDFCKLSDKERCCPQCGLVYKEIDSTEDSEEIVVAVSAHIRRIKRKKYIRGCQCKNVPVIITAPPPPKLIPRGILGISVWVMILLDKYLSYRPTHRLLEQLRLHGIDIPQGTLTGGLKKLAPLFEPVLEGIRQKHLTEKRWHADETRWLVFQAVENKIGYRWYMWVFISKSTVIYKLDESRSSKVPHQHFATIDEGVLIVDRYSAYKKLIRFVNILLAFCWAHVRRDFISVAKDWPKLEGWAVQWIQSIGALYYLNGLRITKGNNTQGHIDADAQLRAKIKEMEQQRDDELAQCNLHPACRKTLRSLKRHWEGLTLFVDRPEIPRDNNEAERRERLAVLGRKNYYGSGSVWSGHLAATMFSIFQTLALCGINSQLWLTAYLQACADNGGKAPEDLASFLPWNMTDEQRRVFAVRGKTKASS